MLRDARVEPQNGLKSNLQEKVGSFRNCGPGGFEPATSSLGNCTSSDDKGHSVFNPLFLAIESIKVFDLVFGGHLFGDLMETAISFL
jgi:hypothetical protein